MMVELAPVPHVIAVVAGRSVTELPTDLFIPPDALEILLDSFTGPLDLLLYLIRQQNIDIMDIPMAIITQQYMQYIELLEAHRMELAADYLVMAALLTEIKSKLLLPTPVSLLDQIEEDPRMELVRRLQAYEFFKEMALFIDKLPRFERDVFQVQAKIAHLQLKMQEPDITLAALAAAMENILSRQQCLTHHQVTREPLSVRERMTMILQRLQDEPLINFTQLLNHKEGRMGIVVTLLATLELVKQALVIVTQTEAFSPIHIRTN